MSPQQKQAHQRMMSELTVLDHIDKENRPQKKSTGGKNGADHFRKKIKIPLFGR